MRNLRTTAALGAVALLALTTAGTAVASDAQSCEGTVEFSEDGTTWAASDPRLSGAATGTGGWSFYTPPEEDAGTTVEDRSYIIINEDGSWNCAVSTPAGPEPDATGHTLVFAGSGDYEGLTAHVRIDWNTYPFGFSGIILEDSVPEDPTLAG